MQRTTPSQLSKLLAPAVLLSAMLAVPVAARAADYALDGYLSNDSNSSCLVLREHDGTMRMVAGATRGLQPGDHVRLLGRSVDAGICNANGTAYMVTQVQTLWGDDRHRTTYYDHLTDGSFQSYSRGRLGSERSTYYPPPVEERSALPVVSLRGRVYNDSQYCPTLHTADGRVYGLVGELPRLRDDSRVRVTGWLDRRSSECGNVPTLEVRDLNRY